jgi:DNA-binding NarL/FixJ family response regulator
MNTRVLLVDDVKPLRHAMADLLRSVGPFDIVAEHSTEAEARLWLQEHGSAWDIAVVDLILEQGTGMGVLARAREVSRTGRIAVFSDYVTPGVVKHCLQLGADAVFQKNGQLEALVDWCQSTQA